MGSARTAQIDLQLRIQPYGAHHQRCLHAPGKGHRCADAQPGRAEGAEVDDAEEVILEKLINTATGTEINAINEFEDIACRHPEGRERLVAAGLPD